MLAAVSVAAGIHTAIAAPATEPARAAATARHAWADRGAVGFRRSTSGWGRPSLQLASSSRPAPAAPSAIRLPTARPPAGPQHVRPVDGPITGAFGEPRASGPHPGVDLDGDTGDPIKSAATGTVLMAGPAPPGWGGYGTVVLLDHGNGVQSLYAHLSAVSVAPGQTVAPGTLVGAMGTTGFVTGSHLHFEVRLNGRPIDPLAWLATPAS